MISSTPAATSAIAVLETPLERVAGCALLAGVVVVAAGVVAACAALAGALAVTVPTGGVPPFVPAGTGTLRAGPPSAASAGAGSASASASARSAANARRAVPRWAVVLCSGSIIHDHARRAHGRPPRSLACPCLARVPARARRYGKRCVSGYFGLVAGIRADRQIGDRGERVGEHLLGVARSIEHADALRL